MKITHKKNNRVYRLALAAVITGIGLFHPAKADIIANFTDGNTTTEVDGWRGTTGGGWSTAWSNNANSSMTTTIGVTSANPLAGGGNYLSARYDLAASAGTLQRSFAVKRTYDSSTGIQLNEAHTVSFLYRYDQASGSLRRIDLYDDGRAAPLLPENANTTWGVNYDPSASTFWRVMDSGITSFATSTVEFHMGDVYQFDVNLLPSANQYQVTILNLDHAANARGGDASFTSELVSFANQAGSVHGQLVFAGRNSGAETFGEFSLDRVAVIPEPATSGLVLLFGVPAVLFLRRNCLK